MHVKALHHRLMDVIRFVMADMTWSEFLSMSTPLAGIILLTVEVLKHRAPDFVSGARGTLVALVVGLAWGLAFSLAPAFRIYDSLVESLVYGAISAIIAAGFHDIAVSPVKTVMKSLIASASEAAHSLGETKVVHMVTDDKPSMTPEDEFVASVERRHQTVPHAPGGNTV